MPLDLGKGARPDEVFHLQYGAPIAEVTYGPLRLWRRVEWHGLKLSDGSLGQFVSTTWPGWGSRRLQFYTGTAKIDGSRTYMLRAGQLGGDLRSLQYAFVVTTTPSEMRAFRVHTISEAVDVMNQGGC